jgi:cell division protein FtsI (penicillin-binding protein 3)
MSRKEQNSRDTIFMRAILVYFISLLLGGAILGKAIHIQTVEKESLLQKAKKQNYKLMTISPLRGTIFSEDKKFLAISIPVFDVSMDFSIPSDSLFNNNVGALAKELSNLFEDKTAQQYKNLLIKQRKKKRGYYRLKRKITYPQLKKLKTFPILKYGRFRGGLIVERFSRRKKPYSLLAERTIGYINEDHKGVGIEYAYDSILKGVEGKKMMQRLASGSWKPMYDDNDIEPINGKDIITGIDVELQDVAENSLNQYLKKFDANWGCAVLMEVQTGYIKAIANLERHITKNNDTVYYESYNHAIGTGIEPGSTFKLASFMAMLEEADINLDDTIKVTRRVKYYDKTIHDDHLLRNGKISIREVLEHSSNVGTSMLISKYFKGKASKYIDYLYHFGLNQKLGLDLIGEAQPYIKNTQDKTWSAVSLPFISIGYELRISPLQILAFYNAIANNGKKVKPLFVESIEEAGTTIRQFEPEIITDDFCSQKTIAKAKSLLEGVVLRGTASRLKNAPFKAAGKTGTAQIAAGGNYDHQNYNASFVGYFPADEPEYSCIVVVNKPRKGYYASEIAVPVFEDIALKVYAMQPSLNKKGRPAKKTAKAPLYFVGDFSEVKNVLDFSGYPIDTSSQNGEWTVVLPRKEKALLSGRKISTNTVPNVKGMGARDAVYILKNLGMQVQLSGKGHVSEQSIAAGSKLTKNQRIELTLR